MYFKVLIHYLTYQKYKVFSKKVWKVKISSFFESGKSNFCCENRIKLWSEWPKKSRPWKSPNILEKDQLLQSKHNLKLKFDWNYILKTINHISRFLLW